MGTVEVWGVQSLWPRLACVERMGLEVVWAERGLIGVYWDNGKETGKY